MAVIVEFQFVHADLYLQDRIKAALEARLGPRIGRIIRRIGAGIESRPLTKAPEEYRIRQPIERRLADALEVGADFANNAVSQALVKSGLDSADIRAICSTSVTVPSIPSLDVRVVQDRGLPCGVRSLTPSGAGCGGGAAVLACAAEFLSGHPEAAALCFAVELCSMTVSFEHHSIDQLLAMLLFGDGAGAAVVLGDEHGRARGPGIRILGQTSHVVEGTEDLLRYDMTESGFNVTLSRSLSKTVKSTIGEAVTGLLDKIGLGISDIRIPVIHPGGVRILASVESALGLSREALEPSYRSLRRFGNLSSVSIFSVLKEAETHFRPRPGDLGLLVSIGPGVRFECLALEWT